MLQHTPVLGGPAPRNATRTASKLAGFALRHIHSINTWVKSDWCLDIGCGNGFITTYLSSAFDRVVGIDVEPDRLEDFHNFVRDDNQYHVIRMSGDAIAFPNDTFALVTSFEVLEHVPDLEATIDEMVRVCRPGGIIVISVPHVWFPFENHGLLINGRRIDQKIPLLPYIRPLHRRFAAARVFASADLDRFFECRGLRQIETAYASPQFERAATRPNSWERYFTFLRSALERSENTPVLRQLTGVSMLKAYHKPLAPGVCA
jgi:SAM-dependent methyltransferase